MGFRVLFVGQIARLFARERLGVLPSERAPQLLIDLGLAPRQVLRLANQVAHLAARLLAAQPGKRLLRLPQPFRRAPGLGFTLRRAGLLRGSRAAHILDGLLQPVQRLLKLLRGRSAELPALLLPHLSLLLALSSLLLPHLAALALLAGLPALLALLARLLALLALLPLLTGLLALLPLLAAAQLAAVLRRLLQLLPQLFRLAAQQLLLPALLRRLLLPLPLLLGQLLLAFGELLQLFERVVDLALALVGGLRLAIALVLVLFGVELQVEKALQIARGPVLATTAAAPPALPSERHLNVAEGGFRP